MEGASINSHYVYSATRLLQKEGHHVLPYVTTSLLSERSYNVTMEKLQKSYNGTTWGELQKTLISNRAGVAPGEG